MEITRLTHVDENVLAQINALLPQLNPALQPLTPEQLQTIIDTKDNAVFTSVDTATGRIVGTTQLITVHQLAGTKCWIEDVVVSQDYRGAGVGRQLLEHAIQAAPEDATSINLTSNPRRESAQRLYNNLGFEVRDTVVFRRTPTKN